MGGEWRDITLGEFIVLQRGHDLTEPERRPGRVPVVGSAGLNGCHDTALAPGPGIVIGRSGASFGQVHLCEDDFWPHNTGLYVTDFKGNDPHFAYYFLRGLNFDRYNSGSAQPSLNRNYIYPIPIRVPPPSEQRAIAHILGSLDDKIELNRRTNETLEAMARVLFKSWFVDFDPVRAKAEGRRPSGMDEETAGLFPSEFVESELGEIPRGWSVRPIGDLADVVGGSTPSTKDPAYWEGGAHAWATPKDLSGLATPVMLRTERRITAAGLGQIGSGLLPRGTVLLSSRAPIGYLAITDLPSAINQGFVAMQPRTGVPNLFLLRWAEWAHEAIVSRANGSTFLEISKSNFRPIPVVAPPGEVLAAYERESRAVHDRVVSNERESIVLAGIRDSLLPKLLSGEASVAGAERIDG